ncbi:MAG TPA: DedA family protein [Wenzhouxiangellaceae bacterium]|nr:DedA family protein [Wenzhouxiangellaceae bacterium]
MDKIIDPLFELSPLTIYLLLAAFCWTEAAFFLGFITPGELAVITGGILASRADVEFGILLIVVSCATIAGNATGFFLGRRYGDGVLESNMMQRFLSHPIRKARAFMRERGEWAIVLGRVSTPTRVMTPFLAGASGLAYRRFVIFDVFASVLWATCFLTLGYLLGASWDLIEDISGAASALVVLLVFVALLIRWIATWVAAHKTRVQALFRLALRATGTRGLARMLAPGFRWTRRRFDPRLAQGLNLTVCFAALLAAIAGIGVVFSQSQAVWGLARIDFPVLDWMTDARTEDAVAAARHVLRAFHWPGVVGIVVPVVAVVLWSTDWAAAMRFAAGILGATGGAFALDRFVLEGHVPSAEFPAVSVSAAAALVVHATALVARVRSWGAGVVCGAFGAFGLVLVALAGIVAGWAAPSGITLGLAMGLGWAALLELPWAARPAAGAPEASDEDGVDAGSSTGGAT